MGAYLFGDSREPPELLALVEQAVGPERFLRGCFETADYALFDRCGCAIGIERKTVGDFLASLADGRVRKQFQRLREAYHPILLLEGRQGISERGYFQTYGLRGQPQNTGWRHAAVQMVLFALQGQGVRIIWTADHQGTADVLRVLLLRSLEKCLAQQWTWEMLEEMQRDGRGVPATSSVLWLEPAPDRGGPGVHAEGRGKLGNGLRARAAVGKDLGARPAAKTLSAAALPRKRQRPA